MKITRLFSLLLIVTLISSLFVGVAFAQEPEEDPAGTTEAQPTEQTVNETTLQQTDEVTETETVEPTDEPTDQPTEEPTGEPTEEPTGEPTEEPTGEPTDQPTEEPTGEPTAAPTEEPTEEPTDQPTEEPTAAPTEEPTAAPTEEPTPTVTPEITEPLTDTTTVTETTVVTETVTPSSEVHSAADPSDAEYTNFQIQNLASGSNFIQVSVYDENGNLAGSDSVTLDAGEVVAYTQNPLGSDPFGLPSGFKGNVVVTAEGQVGAIANQFVGNLGPGQSSISAAYTGVSAPSSTLAFPLAFRSFINWTTRIHLQNTTGNTANVTVNLAAYAGSSNSNGTSKDIQIPGNGSKTFSLYNDAPELGSEWQGNVTITSNQPLAGIADLYWDAAGNTNDYMMNYNAFGADDTDTTLYTPTLFRRYIEPNFGWNTNIFVSNMGGGPADICVKYVGSGVLNSNPDCQNDIPVGGAARFSQFNSSSFLPDNWTGSAIVTSDQPIAAVVGQVTSTGPNDRAAAYSGLAGKNLKSKYSAPFLMKWYASPGWNTNFTALIPDGSTKQVCVTYDTGAQTCTDVNGSALIRQANDPNIANGFRGSGTISSSVPFALIVNMNASAPGLKDLSEAYNAIPVQ